MRREFLEKRFVREEISKKRNFKEKSCEGENGDSRKEILKRRGFLERRDFLREEKSFSSLRFFLHNS